MPSQNQARTVDIAMMDLGPDHALFDEALEAVRATITEKHQRTFRPHADVPSLLHDLQGICSQDTEEQRRLLACKERFALFARRFAPYFELLSISIPAKSDWLSLFWSTVRLVFEVGSSYVLFLDKIADAFATIAHALPDYQLLYEDYRHRVQDQSYDKQLPTLLSYIYADLVQFCLDLYQVFSRRSHGVALRHLRLSTPTLFWRPLDSRLSKLEARLVEHKKWLTGEIANNAPDYASIAQHRREYIEFLHDQAEAGEGSELVEQRMAKRMRRVDRVKAWLSNACAYRDIYDHRIRQRHPSTCIWFLDTVEYCRWKHAPFDQALANDAEELESNWHDRVLYVQAKSGFGKSCISSAVIEDLDAESDNLIIDDDNEPPTTAYFHFNAAHSYCTHPSDAIRALTYQLLHTHRHDRSTLDAIALLMRKSAPYTHASSDDVLIVLSLLLRQHPTFLVIDGVDECSDVDLFLHSVTQLCRASDTRVIMFSRPEIRIPSQYHSAALASPHVLHLAADSNKDDIDAYLCENLNRMAEQGFFGIYADRSLIPRIAARANGLFLWASLLLKYLQSPSLSPDQRRAVLEEADQYEGLESLYRNTLTMLDRRPQMEKDVVANVFRTLSLSINRMCIRGLHTALAITPGQRTAETSYLSNFPESISKLTCGLVEVTECSVVFAHRSIKEYLQSPGFQDSGFSLFDESAAHGHLAARCISFLAHDIPKRPLGRLQPYFRPAPVSHATSSGESLRTAKSGDSGYKSMSSASESEGLRSPRSAVSLPPVQEEEPCSPAFDAEIPFLRYSSLCWPIHLTRTLSTASTQQRLRWQDSSDPFREMPWLPPLSAFLTDRWAVSTFVEASWRYSLPPNLTRLIPLLESLRSRTPPATIQGRELRWVVHGVRELSEALNELKDEYGTTLRENPSLIWQYRGTGGGWRQVGHVTAAPAVGGRAGRGSFWPVWNERVGRAQGAVL